MYLGARMSLIIYLQPCSESMTLASLISRISLHPLKPRFFSSSKGMEIFGFEKKTLLGACFLC
jgi:hypothetical protein